MSPNSATYTGHGKEYGLQQHSCGDMYPFTIVGTSQGHGPTKWRWENVKTGQFGEWQHTQNLAIIDLYNRKVTALMHS